MTKPKLVAIPGQPGIVCIRPERIKRECGRRS